MSVSKEPVQLGLQDQVFALRDGFSCIVAGRTFGPWRMRQYAEAGMATEQRRVRDLVHRILSDFVEEGQEDAVKEMDAQDLWADLVDSDSRIERYTPNGVMKHVMTWRRS